MIATPLHRVIAWLRQRSRNYSAVRADATAESLRRFRWFVLVAIPLHAVFFWQFSHYPVPAGRPDLVEWARSVAVPHGVMLFVVTVLGGLTAWHLRQPKRSSAWGYFLQLAVFGSYLMMGAVLTLADIKVGAPTGIGSYLLTSVVVSAMLLLRPGVSVPAFFAVAWFFKEGLLRFSLSADQFATMQLITLAVPVLSSVVSVMIWQQYVKATLLQRELSASNAELMYLAQNDALTGLHNRRYFMQETGAELARAARAQSPTSMLILDIDFFKKINDEYGHPVGDVVLQQVAQLLAAGVRATDIVARLGGEEFVILMPHTARAGALALGEKLRASLDQQDLHCKNHVLHVTLSVGVSELAAGGVGLYEDLYTAADKALYVAKTNGRNRVEFGDLASQAHSRPGDGI